jgi:predicted Zn-dependent protease
MLPLNPARIPVLYKQALDLQNRGDRGGAREIYRTILATRPDIPEAVFQNARLDLADLDFPAAVDGFARAVALKPREPAIWGGYVEALLRLNDARKTKAALKSLSASGMPAPQKRDIRARLVKRSAKSKVDIGGLRPQQIAKLLETRARGNPEQVEKQARALITKHPRIAILHNILAESLLHQGKTDAAGQRFRKTLEIDPDYAEGHSKYGEFLLQTGNPADAVQHLETARSRIPGSVPNLIALATAYLETGKPDAALETVNSAVKTAPDDPNPLFIRGRIYAEQGKHDAAITDFEHSRALGNNAVAVSTNQARSLNRANRADAALQVIRAALETSPDSLAVHECYVSILQENAMFDQVEPAFRDLIRIAPDAGESFRIFSASHKFTADDPLLHHMQEQFENPALAPSAKPQFGFALSKAMEDIGETAKVFPYLKAANDMMRDLHPYDISMRRQEIDAVKTAFRKADLSTSREAADTDFGPIFITGMPRSGTTLVEQIVASHSTVTGGGEIGWFPRRCLSLINPSPVRTRAIDEIPDDEIAALATDFETYMHGRFPDAKQHITDKSIQTYLFTGFVRMSLPNAKIVVVRRDPRDNLFSIYKNMFPAGSHLYSYNLSDLAAYYKMFVEIIEFWRAKSPDRFYEIHYEDLIADPEAESRKLIAACGLEWEDGCLDFHKNRRRVETLSVFQVRQPIYKSSVAAWEKYSDDLQELFDALKD